MRRYTEVALQDGLRVQLIQLLEAEQRLNAFPPRCACGPWVAGRILLYSTLLCSALIGRGCTPERAVPLCARARPVGSGFGPTAALVLAPVGMAGLTPEGAWTTAEVPQARRLRAASAAALRSEWCE